MELAKTNTRRKRMKKRKFLSLILAGALMIGTVSAPAYAAKGDVEGGGGTDTTPVYSSETVTVPDNLADGIYVGTARVEPDESEEFNFYPISVAVKVSGGAIESFLVSGASTSDVQYSKNAEAGINQQLAQKGAGEVKVDAVAMATCSSYSIVQAINMALQSEPTSTFYTLGEEATGKAIYNPSGTSFDLTVISPEAGVDYSDIAVSYAVGKFSDALTKDTDYTVELVKSDAEEIVYRITILPVVFEIEDDDITHVETYNSLGRTLDVTVAGSSAGRITILSDATVSLDNNKLTLTGGNGETLADYISGIGTVKLAYADKNGDAVLKSYTTQWQHDIEPEFTGNDFFNKDGRVNFSLAPFAMGPSASYTMSIESSGFETVVATDVGNVPSIKNATVSGIKNVYATGKKIIPSVTVKVGSKTLSKDDYDVTVTNNVKPGTATVKITGKRDYTGTITKTFKIYAKKGATYTAGNYKYKVTNASTNGKGTVTVTGFAKTKTSIAIGGTVKIGTVSYKITAIGAKAFKNKTKATKITIGANVKTIGSQAFYNCKKVKTVTISTKKLTTKTVKSQAFKKVGASNYKKVTVKVPSSKLKAYKKFLTKKGLSSKAKIKKI